MLDYRMLLLSDIWEARLKIKGTAILKSMSSLCCPTSVGLMLARRTIISMGTLPSPYIFQPCYAASRHQARRILHPPGCVGSTGSMFPFSSTSNKKQQQPEPEATGDKKNKKSKSAGPPELSYYEQKAAAKNHRRALHQIKVQRQERIKTRRSGRPRTFFRNEFRNFFIPKKVHDEFHIRKARQAGLDWEIQAAAIIERTNVVQPDMEDWEIEMDELQTHLSQYGKRYPKELVGDIYPDKYTPMNNDELLAQLPFVPAPRETPADASGDIRTTDRKLKTSVYLFLKKENRWEFPSVILGPDELLLEGAKRAMKPMYGLKFWCPSNAPWSVQITPFSREEQQMKNVYGLKTFFVMMQYDTGTVPENMDFGWLDRGEITKRVEQVDGQHVSRLYHYML